MRKQKIEGEKPTAEIIELRRAIWLATAHNYERIYRKRLSPDNIVHLTDAVDNMVARIEKC